MLAPFGSLNGIRATERFDEPLRRELDELQVDAAPYVRRIAPENLPNTSSHLPMELPVAGRRF